MKEAPFTQEVEIALGPTGAFENGNIGNLMRKVPADRVVSAVPERQRRVKSLPPPREPRTPAVVATLRKAIAWRQELDSGAVATQAEIARREGISRARATQVLGLLRLTPEIQGHILALPKIVCRPRISEHAVRTISRLENPDDQMARFGKFPVVHR